MSRRSDHPSPGQPCNGDVLLDLFLYLSEGDLAHTALVCRTWSAPAHMTLYNTISFDSSSPRATQLAWTLRTRPELRELVCHLIYTSHHHDPEPPDWLALLPEGSLRTLNWGSDTFIDLPADVFRLPAVRTVSKLVLHINPSSKAEDIWSAIQDMMLNPSLHSLSVGPRVAERVSLPSGLKHFSVFAPAYTEQVKRLVTDPDTQLERFDACIGQRDVRALMQDLRRCQTRLKHLTFITGVNHWQYTSLMGESLHSFPLLETLVCSSTVCSPDLLLHLPPTVRSLTILARAFARHRCLDFTRAVRDCLAKTERGSSQRRLPESVAIVEVCMRSWQLARPVTQDLAHELQRMDELADVCMAAGTRLDWVGVKDKEFDYLLPYSFYRPYLVAHQQIVQTSDN